MHMETSDTGSPTDCLAEMTAKEIRSASLLCALLIGVPTAIGCFLIDESGPVRQPTEIGSCAPIAENNARLACYDEASQYLVPEPFKGAVAPLPGKTL